MFADTLKHVAEKDIALAIFALTYLGIAAGRVPGLKLDRTGIVMLGAISVMVFGGMPTTEVIEFIDWPTILLLFGFFVISAQLRLSGFFDTVANRVAQRIGNPARFLWMLMLATASLSAFLNHDIVCVAFAPIVAVALQRRRLNPIPFLVALAIASNIGAAATIVGNPQDMMIAQVAGLEFGHYVLWSFVPVSFALVSAYGIIWLLSRRRMETPAIAIAEITSPPFPFNRPHTIKGLIILGIVILLFFTPLPKELIALTAAGIHLASRKFSTEDILKQVNWPILVLFMGLFIVTGAFQTTGYGTDAVQWLKEHGLQMQSSPILAIVTAALSNLINNSAAVMLLLKVASVAQPPAAYVLALANSFGGSLFVVGSVSNIIVVQQAREMGIEVSFREFARLGVPVTLVALSGLIGWVMLIG
ncbi:MAG: anion transporter [Phycisphaerales bacterium]|nr:anion transporter [Phycisphaerales bacterium]MCB9863157.1 anion transporter [Phycisphaerales bacterium]